MAFIALPNFQFSVFKQLAGREIFHHLQQNLQFAKTLSSRKCHSFHVKPCVLDLDYLSDPSNETEIKTNIANRKGVGCIDSFKTLLNQYKTVSSPSEKSELWEKLLQEGLKIPNRSDPQILSYGEVPLVVKMCGSKPTWSFQPKQFHEITKPSGTLRTENLGLVTGHRSYYFIDQLALLEQALIRYTVDILMSKGFVLYSVPDLLDSKVIESCGMDTKGERTQVYRLDPKFYGDVCLSGTAEMALASFYSNQSVAVSKLPLKMAAVSRCYRAETSSIQEERGVYRVHQFTKVEMFGITSGDVLASDKLLAEFVEIQQELFDSLGFHYQLLDMPLHELGAPAYRKFDIEAWMPGRGMYGEISSASSCSDYQARRMAIDAIDSQGSRRLAHTVNGTACAIPRMLITLLETHQMADGRVSIPAPLQPYCGALQHLHVDDDESLKLRWIRSKAQKHAD